MHRASGRAADATQNRRTHRFENVEARPQSITAAGL